MKNICVIGGGISGLSAACYMAKAGFKVDLFEKNNTLGGRARQMHLKGFKFDMGPTFYWMPDIFDRFFTDFNKKREDYYTLSRLNPSYEIYFKDGNSIPLSASLEEIKETFEKHEQGSGVFLEKFMRRSEKNYRIAVDKILYKPGKSFRELVIPDTIKGVSQFTTTLGQHVRKNIQHESLRQILEFPVLFLGSEASRLPLFYNLMNYADMGLGTWHIEGGIYKLIESMKQLAEESGVNIHTSTPVEKIEVINKKINGVFTKNGFTPCDALISGADYAHTEQLIEKPHRNYTDNYWKKRVMAPSALLFYIGFDKKLNNISHHTLFFDTDFNKHIDNIYKKPDWPGEPLFYASFPSVSDSTLAPKGKEMAILLVPIACGLKDCNDIRHFYFNQLIERLEKLTHQRLKDNVLFYKSYSVNNFIKDYNAYQGNAYGLANTLMQTAVFKPKIQNRKVKNLFYAGQLTVPGPGMPPALISGKIASEAAINYLYNN